MYIQPNNAPTPSTNIADIVQKIFLKLIYFLLEQIYQLLSNLKNVATINENIGKEQLSERSEFCDCLCFQLKGALSIFLLRKVINLFI